MSNKWVYDPENADDDDDDEEKLPLSSMIAPPPRPELKEGETVCHQSVGEAFPSHLASTYISAGILFVLGFGMLLRYSDVSFRISVGIATITSVVVLVSAAEPLAVHLTKRAITNASCKKCGYCQTARAIFDCECGEKVPVERHMADPCPRCRRWASFLRCPWCRGYIEVWGEPPGSYREGYKWLAHRLTVTKFSARSSQS